MISVLVLVFGLAFAAYLFYKKFAQEITKSLPIPVAVLAATILVAIFQPYAIERIDAGSVGIKFNMVGSDQGVGDYEYKSGWCLYNSWFSKIIEIPVYQQHVEYGKQTAITKGGLPVEINPSLNYAVVQSQAGDMYVNLRKPISDIEKGWLKNAVVSSINDETNKWKPDSIFNHREVFEAAIVVECNKRVGKWFTVSQLRTNMIPPVSLTESIEKKTRAVQDVQVAESQKLVAEAEAQRKIAVAKGDSAEAVIAAAGRAEAIRREQLNLTPLYLEYIRAHAWNGVLPTTVLGGQNLMVPLK